MYKYKLKNRKVGVLAPQEIVTVDMPRSRFLELVEDELQHYPELRERLLPVAETMPRFPLGVWQHVERGCGCVVGEYLIASSEMTRAELANNMLADFSGELVTVESLLYNSPQAGQLIEFGEGIDLAMRNEVVFGAIKSIEIIDEH